jgi:hypothetical protein
VLLAQFSGNLDKISHLVCAYYQDSETLHRLENFPRLAGRLLILPQACVAIDSVESAMPAASSFAPDRAHAQLKFLP